MARPSWRTPALLTSTRIGPKRSRSCAKALVDGLGVGDVGLHVAAGASHRGDGVALVAQAAGDRRADAARAAGHDGAPGAGGLRRRHARAPSSPRSPRPTRSPRRRRPARRWRRVAAGPSRSACASASGIEADEVLATRSRLSATRARSRPSSAAAASMIRALAWWATKRSTSSTPRPLRSSASLRRLRPCARRRGGRPRGPPCAASRSSSSAKSRSACVPSAPRTKPLPQPRAWWLAGDDDRAGAVAEEDRGPAVVVVREARQRLGAADEHDARASGLDERGGLVERVDEPGAGGVDVDRGGARARRCAARPRARARA